MKFLVSCFFFFIVAQLSAQQKIDLPGYNTTIHSTGKFANFIIVDKDLMNIGDNEILKTNVLMTFVNGEKVFEKK